MDTAARQFIIIVILALFLTSMLMGFLSNGGKEYLYTAIQQKRKIRIFVSLTILVLVFSLLGFILSGFITPQVIISAILGAFGVLLTIYIMLHTFRTVWWSEMQFTRLSVDLQFPSPQPLAHPPMPAFNLEMNNDGALSFPDVGLQFPPPQPLGYPSMTLEMDGEQQLERPNINSQLISDPTQKAVAKISRADSKAKIAANKTHYASCHARKILPQSSSTKSSPKGVDYKSTKKIAKPEVPSPLSLVGNKKRNY